MLKDESKGTVQFELRIGSVQDPVRLDRLTGQLGRRGEFPYFSSGLTMVSAEADTPTLSLSLSPCVAFSLDSLYGRTLQTACPVAASSVIELVVPSHSVNPFVIEPDLARETRNIDGRDVAVWDVAAGEADGRFRGAGRERTGADVLFVAFLCGAALEEAALDVRVSWPDENVFHPREFPSALSLSFAASKDPEQGERVLRSAAVENPSDSAAGRAAATNRRGAGTRTARRRGDQSSRGGGRGRLGRDVAVVGADFCPHARSGRRGQSIHR